MKITLLLLALNLAQLSRPLSDEWPTYHGDYSGRHYSALNQINQSNVKNLSLAWVYRPSLSTEGAIVGGDGPDPQGAAGADGRGPTIKSIPLMVNGVLYLSVPSHAYAVDARTGQEIWHYYWKSRPVIGNRGMAMYGNWLYFETPDNNLVSLDAATGRERWHKKIVSEKLLYFSTAAPVVIGNHVITGAGGDSADNPCWLEARDPETGNVQWRWFTTPRKGEPGIETWPNPDAAEHGGGGPWQPSTYDPELKLIYVTTANPNPVLNGRTRQGDNLYTASIVALHADTGKMAWYFQCSPHDTHDWDATEVPVLFDGVVDGKPRKLLAQANRNGYFFVLDRTNGTNLLTRPFIPTANAFKGVTAEGVLIPDVDKQPQTGGVLVSPSTDGAANYPAPSFDPDTGLFYFHGTESFSIFYLNDSTAKPIGYGGGSEYHTGLFESALRALDYWTGKVRWEHKYPGLGFWSSTHPGMLTTAGKLLFTGDPTGNFMAFDPETGSILWHSGLGHLITNSPETFMIDGRQYVVAAAGDTLFVFSLQ